jgi:hypothetical protein
LQRVRVLAATQKGGFSRAFSGLLLQCNIKAIQPLSRLDPGVPHCSILLIR